MICISAYLALIRKITPAQMNDSPYQSILTVIGTVVGNAYLPFLTVHHPKQGHLRLSTQSPVIIEAVQLHSDAILNALHASGFKNIKTLSISPRYTVRVRPSANILSSLSKTVAGPAFTKRESRKREAARVALGLKTRIEKLGKLKNAIVAFLGRDYLYHLEVSYPEDGQFCIMVDTAAWSTRLRYEIPRLTTHLREQGMSVTEIKVKVAAALRPSEYLSNANSFPHSNSRMSIEQGEYIKQSAECISHKGLSDALTRLAGRAKRTP